MNFTVNTATTFNLLGVFDNGADGIVGPVSVGVYDATTQLFVSPVVTFSNFANSSSYATQRVTPFLLAAGNYQLAAWGFSDTDNNYNSVFTDSHPASAITFNSLGGALTATSVAYSTGTPGDFATSIEESATRYGAGTLGIVPEPATWAMLIAGFGMVGFAMRRRNTALLSA
ncbi:MAG: PEPxxWA-CTERM sorting domain-containing protein [Polymorphobacter sp.]